MVIKLDSPAAFIDKKKKSSTLLFRGQLLYLHPDALWKQSGLCYEFVGTIFGCSQDSHLGHLRPPLLRNSATSVEFDLGLLRVHNDPSSISLQDDIIVLASWPPASGVILIRDDAGLPDGRILLCGRASYARVLFATFRNLPSRMPLGSTGVVAQQYDSCSRHQVMCILPSTDFIFGLEKRSCSVAIPLKCEERLD